MTEVEEISDKGYKKEIGEAILPLDVDLKFIIIQEGPTEGKTFIEMEVTIDSRSLDINPYYQLKDLELHQGL